MIPSNNPKPQLDIRELLSWMLLFVVIVMLLIPSPRARDFDTIRQMSPTDQKTLYDIDEAGGVILYYFEKVGENKDWQNAYKEGRTNLSHSEWKKQREKQRHYEQYQARKLGPY